MVTEDCIPLSYMIFVNGTFL